MQARSQVVTRSQAFVIIAIALSAAALLLHAASLRANLDVNDPRVLAAVEHLSGKSSSSDLLAQGKVVKAWLSTVPQGYCVNIGVESGSGRFSRWHMLVTFDSAGEVTGASMKLWTASLLPSLIGALAVGLMLFWLGLRFIVPVTTGVKCPDCTANPLLPVLAHPTEAMVYEGGFDEQGISLPPIVEITYTCPRCEYQKVVYRIPDWYRGAHNRFPSGHTLLRQGYDILSPVLTRKEHDWYEKMISQYQRTWEKMPKFRTYDEWKEFYEEVKSCEREIRPGK